MRTTFPNLARSAALAILLCALSGLAAAQSASASSPGAATFKAKCTMCHGPDGSGKTMMGEKLKASDLRSDEVQKQSDAQLKEAITNGKAKMPAFKGKLSADQVGQLVAEIREMAKSK